MKALALLVWPLLAVAAWPLADNFAGSLGQAAAFFLDGTLAAMGTALVGAAASWAFGARSAEKPSEEVHGSGERVSPEELARKFKR